MRHTSVLLLRPYLLPGGAARLSWSLYWPATGHRTRERTIFAPRLFDAGELLRAALRPWGAP